MPKYSRLRSGHILARRWFAKAGLEAHADAYIRYLTEHGYAVPTVECYFRCVAHFLHWAVQQHAAFHDVGDALIDRWIASTRTSGLPTTILAGRRADCRC
jgi:site-specific recombinase XerD